MSEDNKTGYTISFMRRIGQWLLRGTGIPLFFTLLVSSPTLSEAQTADAPRGVRHEIFVTFERPPPDILKEDARVTVLVSVRISDHAPDADFFGVVRAVSSEFAADQSQLRVIQKLWADQQCHTNRGMPKVSFVSLFAKIKRPGGQDSHFTALPRRIGKLIPEDEIALGHYWTGRDPARSDMVLTGRTKRSGLQVTLTLRTEYCNIEL